LGTSSEDDSPGPPDDDAAVAASPAAVKRPSMASRIDAMLADDDPEAPEVGDADDVVAELGDELAEDLEVEPEDVEVVASAPVVSVPVIGRSPTPPAVARVPTAAPPPPPGALKVPPLPPVARPGKPPLPALRPPPGAVAKAPATPTPTPSVARTATRGGATRPPAPPRAGRTSAMSAVDVPSEAALAVGDSTLVLDDAAVAASQVDSVDDGLLATSVEVDAAEVDGATVDDEAVAAARAMLEVASPSVLEATLAVSDERAFEARADELAAAVDAADDPAEQARLAYMLGEWCERKLADEARAIKAYGRALSADPSHRANLWAIRRVFQRRQLWPNLIKLIDAELRVAASDDERAELSLEKARLLELHGERGAEADDGGAAWAAVQEARLFAPRHPAVLLEVERALIARAQRGEVVDADLEEVWIEQAEVFADPRRRCALWLDVARARVTHGDLAGALGALGEAASTGADERRVAGERVRVAERLGDPDVLLAALDDAATGLLARFGLAGEAPGDSVEAPTGRALTLRRELVAVRRRQAQVALAADDGDGAWDYLQHALRLLPDEPLLHADLIELAERLDKPDELARALTARVERAAPGPRRTWLQLRRCAALIRSGDLAAASATIDALEASSPGAIPLAAVRDVLAVRRGDVGELAAAWSDAATAIRIGAAAGDGEAVDQPDRHAAAGWGAVGASLWMAAARRPDADEAGRTAALERARLAIEAVLEAVPEHPVALELRVEWLVRCGDEDGAAAELARQVDRATGAAQAAALERLAAFRRERSELDGALDALQRLAAVRPDDLELAWQIEALLAQLGRDDVRGALLESIAAREPSGERRLHALAMAARLAERSGDPGGIDRALALYQQILALDSADEFARDSVIDLLRASGRWGELADARLAQASQLPDGPAASAALAEAAWLLELRLDRPGQAAFAWQALLDRSPDDGRALEGLLRCRRAQGDAIAQVDVLERIVASGDASGARAVELASALEVAGRPDDAADVLGNLAERSAGQVGGQLATWALLERAAIRGESARLEELRAQLVEAGASRPLGRALAEDLGWLRAIVHEDDDGAAAAFAQSLSLEPAIGARLGALLVASRRRDPDEQRAALIAFADTIGAADARMALLLRAAVLARAAADEAEAQRLEAQARAAAPDEVGALVVQIENDVPPRLEELGEAAYAQAMWERAENLAMRADLAGDVRARASWELDRALALEHAGRLAEAGAVVAAVLRADPDDVRALEALRRMSYVGGDLRTAGRAAFHLGKRMGDPTSRIARLREAAAIFDPLAAQTPAAQRARDADAAIATYRRILAIERTGPEFDALLALLRAQGDADGMIAAITEQLAWLAVTGEDRLDADPDAPVALLLERATVRHGRGDQAGAAADLDAVLAHDPERADALRFRGELAATQGDVDGAIEMLRRYLDVEARPARRVEVEQQLAKMLAESALEPSQAVAAMARLIQRNRDDLTLHERMLGLATRAGDHKQVVRTLGDIARLRTDDVDRARDEHRAALVQRDRLADLPAARASLERARRHDPSNLDVVRDLVALLDKPAAQRVLTTVIGEQREAIQAEPGEPAPIERLAVTAALAGEADLRWLTLAVLDEIGVVHAEQRAVLAAGRSITPSLPTGRLTSALRAKLVVAPGQAAAISDLWALIAAAVTAVMGVDPVRLGFVKSDRSALKKLGDRHAAVGRALGMLAVDDAEVWISDKRGGVARAFAGDTPVLCLGADIAAAETSAARFALGRAAQLAASSTGALPDLREIELAWLCVAAIRASEGKVPDALAGAVAADEAAIAERSRALGKTLGRKEKRAIAAWSGSHTLDTVTLGQWRRATIGVANRVGLLLGGDPGVALAQIDAGRSGQAVQDSAAAQDLIKWALGAEHVALRSELGLGRAKGAG
jgi:hypothetical protein